MKILMRSPFGEAGKILEKMRFLEIGKEIEALP